MVGDDPKAWRDVVDPHVPLRQPRNIIPLAELCIVKDARYVELTQSIWIADALEDGLAPPKFNWLAIYNFNPDAAVFALELASAPLALMQVRLGHRVRCSGGTRDPLVYVSFLETAPSNRTGDVQRAKTGYAVSVPR